jgi:hypothetical protein
VTEKAAGPALCPSAPPTPGAKLIGVVEESGRVVNLTMPLTINKDFVETAKANGPIEQRFRFSLLCAEGRCGYWTGLECGLIEKLCQAINSTDSDQPLPPCAIRARCRWWRQRGRDACSVCPFVVTGSKEATGGYLSPR